MDIENAKQEFTKYAEQSDMNDPRIKRKFGHSFRVMQEAEGIAKSLNLSDEDIEIAKLIGLLHDIGKFSQEYKNKDHGDLGAEILIKDDYIRNYIKETKYDNIILKAIKNHNKFAIENGLNDKELLFSKIIRDADKLDIFYEGVEFFWTRQDEIQSVSSSKISPEIMEQFKAKRTIDRKQIKTPVDGVLSFLSFIFDLNFEFSYNRIRKQKYIERILEKFDMQKEDVANILNTVYGI